MQQNTKMKMDTTESAINGKDLLYNSCNDEEGEDTMC